MVRKKIFTCVGGSHDHTQLRYFLEIFAELKKKKKLLYSQPLAMMCDNVYEILSVREAHLSLGA